MKGTRQAEILRIISEVEVETQEQLLDELSKPWNTRHTGHNFPGHQAIASD